MKKRYILGTITLICFIIITILVATNHIKWFDDTINHLVDSIRCIPLDYFFRIITHLGDTIPVLCIILILQFVLKNIKDRLLLGNNIILIVGMNQIIKHAFKRPRPPIAERLVTQGGYSYPSGHAMVSVCIYGVLIYLIQTKIKDKRKKTIYTILLSILILLIGFSRIYVRVHWPSDVLAGYFLATALLIAGIEANRLQNKGAKK